MTSLKHKRTHHLVGQTREFEGQGCECSNVDLVKKIHPSYRLIFLFIFLSPSFSSLKLIEKIHKIFSKFVHKIYFSIITLRMFKYP